MHKALNSETDVITSEAHTVLHEGLGDFAETLRHRKSLQVPEILQCVYGASVTL